jgi:hypothetical protein
MSVLVEAITVVIRCDAIARSFPGGMLAFAANVPNRTFRTDDQLAAVSFMTQMDADVYIASLGKLGLRLAERGKCRDIAVTDALYGPTLLCDWIEFGADSDGTRFAWLRGTTPGPMVAPSWWRPGMLVRADRMPDLQTDPESGHRLFIDDTGANLGEVYGPDDPKTRELHVRRRSLRVAVEAACDALLRREWLFLTVFQAETADFHLVMRYRNQLGLVFVAATTGTASVRTLDRSGKERLLARAREMRGVAIVAHCGLAPVGEDGSEVAPTVESLEFEDASIGVPLGEDKLDTHAQIELSAWEVLDFAIAHVRDRMENEGYRIEHWTSEPLPGPHIVAWKDGAITRVVVSGRRFPIASAVFDQDRLSSVAEATLNGGGAFAKADVMFAHSDDPLTGEDVLPLYRGEPVSIGYKGLQFLDPNRVLGHASKGVADRTKALVRTARAFFTGKPRGSNAEN